jgi:hypothetical protein
MTSLSLLLLATPDPGTARLGVFGMGLGSYLVADGVKQVKGGKAWGYDTESGHPLVKWMGHILQSLVPSQWQ